MFISNKSDTKLCASRRPKCVCVSHRVHSLLYAYSTYIVVGARKFIDSRFGCAARCASLWERENARKTAYSAHTCSSRPPHRLSVPGQG